MTDSSRPYPSYTADSARTDVAKFYALARTKAISNIIIDIQRHAAAGGNTYAFNVTKFNRETAFSVSAGDRPVNLKSHSKFFKAAMKKRGFKVRFSNQSAFSLQSDVLLVISW